MCKWKESKVEKQEKEEERESKSDVAKEKGSSWNRETKIVLIPQQKVIMKKKGDNNNNIQIGPISRRKYYVCL